MTDTSTTPLVQGRFVVPSVASSHFHLREGDKVADFGAGSGYFVETLVGLVGEEGKVYACEIQKELVEKLGNLARTKGWAHVDPLWADVEEIGGTKIPDEELDTAILVNTLFQLEDKNTSMQEIARTLRSGGKFFVIDWSESFSGLGPQPDAVVTAEEVTNICESQGFVYEHSFDAGDHHYGLAFRKP